MNPSHNPGEFAVAATSAIAHVHGSAWRRRAGEALLLQSAAALLALAMNAVLGRALGPGAYGLFSYALAAAGLVGTIACLGLPNSAMRFVAEYRASKSWGELKGVLVRTAQIVALASAAGALLLVAAGGVSGPTLATPLLLAAAMVPFVALGQWRSRAVRGFNRIVRSVLPEDVLVPAVVIVGVLLLSRLTAPKAVLVWLAASAGALAFGGFLLVTAVPAQAAKARPTYHTATWLSVSLPMTFGGFMQLAVNRQDVLLVGTIAGMQATGVYAAAARIALLGVFALRVVDVFSAPEIATAYFERRPEDVRAAFLRGQLLSTLGGLPPIVLALVAPQWLLGLFGAKYVVGAPVLRILATGQFVNAATGPVGFGLLMTGHEKSYAWIMGLSTLLGALALLVVIPKWSTTGAAIVTAATIASANLAMLAAFHAKVLRAAAAEPAGSPGERP
jgi:O-antigen/teichoic acid export membrane protein